MTRVVLGLGSNLLNPLQYLREARQRLIQLSDLYYLRCSPIYQSDALVEANAPAAWHKPYLNMAVLVETALAPQELLPQLKRIEQEMGRQSQGRWSPREIDVDILAWGESVIHEPRIQVPHKELLARPFALWPLLDVWPDWKHPQHAIEIGAWGSRFEGKAPLNTRQLPHRAKPPYVMGVVNITPDSFSDGGKYFAADQAIAQAERLFQAGADILDIGAESTRPGGAKPLSAAEEWQRLEPVLSGLQALWQSVALRPKISLDSYRLETIRKARPYGIDWINDQCGDAMPEIVAELVDTDIGYISMHHCGIPANTQTVPLDQSVVAVVKTWCQKRYAELRTFGLRHEQILLDVGIGFGKNAQQSVQLLHHIDEIAGEVPLLVGHSRKSFLNPITSLPYVERDLESAVISALLAKTRVHALRVHSADATVRALRVYDYISSEE